MPVGQTVLLSAPLTMRSAVLCHALQDAQFAKELGDFLELNCPLTVSHQEAADVVEAVERGLSDVTLVLLSPDCSLGKRERWEPVLLNQPKELGTDIAFLLLRECKFPDLLRRQHFFDLSQDLLLGRRALKRWLLKHSHQITVNLPDRSAAQVLTSEALEDLRSRLADSPGPEEDLAPEAALAFAHACKDEFEGVFWIDCAHRSRAGILGDAAQALGLRLSGTLEQNRTALRDFCAGRRCLFVLENIAAEDQQFATFAGKSSVIFTDRGLPRSRRSFEETAALFSAWTRNTDACLPALGDARSFLRTSKDSMQLGPSMVALLKHQDRLAEAYEILDMLVQAARATDDLASLRRFAWEQSWILERWDEPVSLDVPLPLFREPKQLTLAFSD
jgi:hypothetical protein